MKYANWLRAALSIEAPPEWSEQFADDLRETIRECSIRAALAGVPEAVKLCDIRAGGVSLSIAREILAGCFAACQKPVEPAAGPLTVKEAAAALKVSERTVRGLIASGKLGHHRVGNGRGQVRILPRDVEDYQGKPTEYSFKYLFR